MVDFATLDGTALAGADYDASPARWRFRRARRRRRSRCRSSTTRWTRTTRSSSWCCRTPQRRPAGRSGRRDDPRRRSAADVSIDDVTVHETDGTAAFTLTLSSRERPRDPAAYATLDQTALAGADYAATSGTVTITAGETTATVAVGILDDPPMSPTRPSSSGCRRRCTSTIADGEGVGTILDDDRRRRSPSTTSPWLKATREPSRRGSR